MGPPVKGDGSRSAFGPFRTWLLLHGGRPVALSEADIEHNATWCAVLCSMETGAGGQPRAVAGKAGSPCKYAEILAEHVEVSVRDLPHLTEDDLKGLGLPLGPRRRLHGALSNRATSFFDLAATRTAHRKRRGIPHEKATPVRSAPTTSYHGISQTSSPGPPGCPGSWIRKICGTYSQRYQDTVAAVVGRYDGHIAKFLGDAYRLFQLATGHEDDGEPGVRAVLRSLFAVFEIEVLTRASTCRPARHRDRLRLGRCRGPSKQRSPRYERR